MTNKKILVFTACYNEKQNIKKLIEKINKSVPKVDILIIDDNSPDQSGLEIKKLIGKFSNLNLVIRNEKLGLDTAHKYAYLYALKKNYDFLITMDSDLSHDPKELRKIINNLFFYPFVIGSRYIKGGKCLLAGIRLFISKYGNHIIKLLSGVNCNEFTTSYRGFNIKKLKGFNLNQINEKGYSFFMGTVFRISMCKFQIKQVPITFYEREKGVSKISKIEIFRTFKNLFFFILKKYLN